MINIKYCKKCKNAFDIGNNKDLCYKCRKNTKLTKPHGDSDENIL